MHVDHTHNIIEVRHVSSSYHHHEVLHNINLDIHKGDYLAIIGPNGSGKTTLAKIILGIKKADKGTVHLFGEELSTFDQWHRIGYVAQRSAHHEQQFPATAYEIVSMGLYAKKGLFHHLHANDHTHIHECMERVGMWEHRHTRIGELSGGQQQRIHIARALVGNPDVLFLDEPTVGIDIRAQERFYELLRELNSVHHITLVVISHDIDVIAHEATEFACINKTLVYHGPPKDFISGEYFEKLYGKGVKFVLHGH